MAGITETKELMLAAVQLSMALDKATQNGFQWYDIIDMLPALTKLPGAIEGIEEVPAEINDMDEAERAELVEAIEQLDFVSDRSEAIAEQSLRAGLEIGKLIVVIRESTQ